MAFLHGLPQRNPLRNERLSEMTSARRQRLHQTSAPVPRSSLLIRYSKQESEEFLQDPE